MGECRDAELFDRAWRQAVLLPADLRRARYTVYARYDVSHEYQERPGGRCRRRYRRRIVASQLHRVHGRRVRRQGERRAGGSSARVPHQENRLTQITQMAWIREPALSAEIESRD